MVEKMLFEQDPATGKTTWMYYDHATDEITFETVQDFAPIGEVNKALFNDASKKGARFRNDFRTKVASIPMVLYFRLQQEGILDDQDRLAKWLDDPDNRMFRTTPGRLR